MADVIFVAFDTETTGLNARKDRLVELAAVKFQLGRVLEEKTWLINPGQPIPPAAEAIHHISDAMVRNKPDFKTIYPEFERFIRGAVLLAHNARFDVSFLSAECARQRRAPPPNPVLDTLPLFRHWFPTVKSHSITSLTTNLNLTAGTFHRASSDTMYMVLIFEKGCRQEPPGLTMNALSHAAHQPLHFTLPPR
ncbi:MAG: 3'-5' exonuclease [Kiritimatiellaeota bacterium]|nr:3'-5' exonuclease [Kiritimatiellota bacterium]